MHKHVGSFNVAVNNSFRVDVAQGKTYVREESQRFSFRKIVLNPCTFIDFLLQIARVGVLHYNVQLFILRKGLNVLNDVLVLASL